MVPDLHIKILAKFDHDVVFIIGWTLKRDERYERDIKTHNMKQKSSSIYESKIKMYMMIKEASLCINHCGLNIAIQGIFLK